MQYLILDKEENNKQICNKNTNYYSYRYSKWKKQGKIKGEKVTTGYFNNDAVKITRARTKNEKRVEEKLQRKNKRKYKNRIPQKYKVYIESKWWEERKNRYYRTHKKQCCVCGSKKHTQLHHLHYKNLGNEKDEDLIPMCVYHHELFHELYGTKKVMHAEMQEFFEKYNTGDKLAKIKTTGL